MEHKNGDHKDSILSKLWSSSTDFSSETKHTVPSSGRYFGGMQILHVGKVEDLLIKHSILQQLNSYQTGIISTHGK